MAPKLRVSAGPSVDKLSLIRVNDEDHPLKIDTDEFQGRVMVRIQGFNGIRAKSEGGDDEHESASDIQTHYFEHSYAKGCTWSIQVQGRFKKGINVDDVMYGNQFEHSIKDKLPWGTSVALRAIGIIDPNLKHDLYCDQPWAFGPMITSMTRVNVKRNHDDIKEGSFEGWPAFPAGHDEDDYVQENTSVLLCKEEDKEDKQLREEIEKEGLADSNTLKQLSEKESGHSHRGRFWANQHVRQATEFTSKDIFTFSFDNGFIDFNTLRAVLPYTGGMGFDLQKYWDGQPVRYFCKDSSSDKIFFVIEFQIVEKD